MSKMAQIIHVEVENDLSKNDVCTYVVERFTGESKLAELFGIEIGKDKVQNFWRKQIHGNRGDPSVVSSVYLARQSEQVEFGIRMKSDGFATCW